MRRFSSAALVLWIAAAFSGCTEKGDGVREFNIHIGKNPDGSQYLTPKTIEVNHGDKVRFVVINDDPTGVSDNFHDVALLDYDGDGDGIEDDIEHEVPAGKTVTTSFKGNPYFLATAQGTFKIICEVRRGQPTSHEAAGMWGNFVVS